MISANNFFANEDRASYELGNFLRRLPAHLRNVELDAQQRLMVEAAEQHATNLSQTLLHGLEAIGHVMYSSAHSDDCPLDPRQLSGLGELVKELAVQLQFLDDFRASAADNELQLALKGRTK